MLYYSCMKINKKMITLSLVFCLLSNNVGSLILNGFFAYAAEGDAYEDPNELNEEIKFLNGDIENQKNSIKRIQNKQEKYTAIIREKQGEKSSLNNQMAILDNRLAKSGLDIELVETQIKRVKLEVQKTDIEIGENNVVIENEKKHIHPPSPQHRFSLNDRIICIRETRKEKG